MLFWEEISWESKNEMVELYLGAHSMMGDLRSSKILLFWSVKEWKYSKNPQN